MQLIDSLFQRGEELHKVGTLGPMGEIFSECGCCAAAISSTACVPLLSVSAQKLEMYGATQQKKKKSFNFVESRMMVDYKQ